VRVFGSLMLMTVVCAAAWAQQTHDHAAEPFGFRLSEGWFDPTVHSHLSPRGTPYIHPFRIEPAFTRRDLLLDYSYRSTAGPNEREFEAELEWAFSRRLGLALEIPYVWLGHDGQDAASGFGNLTLSPRALLAEYETWLLAFNFGVETPTGSTSRTIAADEVTLAPSLSTWIDLGHWWTLNGQAGTAHGTRSGASELFLRASLHHTLALQDISHEHQDDDHSGHGLPPGFLTVILEADLALGLAGEEDGQWLAEGILGVYYGLGESVDVRAAYVFPLSKSQELNHGLTAGLIWHF
jgi:hypothetical protein